MTPQAIKAALAGGEPLRIQRPRGSRFDNSSSCQFTVVGSSPSYPLTLTRTAEGWRVTGKDEKDKSFTAKVTLTRVEADGFICYEIRKA
jgi:hypothetical protein